MHHVGVMPTAKHNYKVKFGDYFFTKDKLNRHQVVNYLIQQYNLHDLPSETGWTDSRAEVKSATDFNGPLVALCSY